MKFFKVLFVFFLIFTVSACGDSKKNPSTDNDGVSDEDTTASDDDTVLATCGNESVEGSEICDGNIVNCSEIDSTLYLSGKAKCLDDCSGYDTVTCEEIFHECGNETVEGPEVCDGGVKNCVEIDSSMFTGGKAACENDCSGWDTATCEEVETVCGNGTIEGSEVCDLYSKSCYDIDPKYYLGTADCNESCDGWDISGCQEGSAVCGNEVVEGAEKCDGTLDLCIDIDSTKYSGGKAYCDDDCLGWDTITCEEKTPGINWESGESNTAQFDPRASHCAAFFKGNFYVIGGTGFDGVSEKTLADVWTSTDGKIWSLKTDTAAFGERNRHRCLVHDGKLWVIGGRNSSGTEYNDAWFTSNGTDWESDTVPVDGLNAGANSAVISKGSDLFVFGVAPFAGIPSAYKRDSTGWTALPTPPYAGDSSFGFENFNGTMVLAGGIDSTQVTVRNTIYYTSDGQSWDSATGSFNARAFASMISVGDSLYLIGGNTLVVRLGDIWESKNGTDFEQISTDSGFAPRSSHAVAVSDKKLCIIAGTLVDNSYTSDVWCVEL